MPFTLAAPARSSAPFLPTAACPSAPRQCPTCSTWPIGGHTRSLRAASPKSGPSSSTTWSRAPTSSSQRAPTTSLAEPGTSLLGELSSLAKSERSDAVGEERSGRLQQAEHALLLITQARGG